MILNALPCRNSLGRIGFQPVMKIDDVEIWVNSDMGLYATLWWIGENPRDSCLLQSEHVRFRVGNKRQVQAILEPGVMLTYVPPDHELWDMDDDEDGEDDEDD